MALDPSSGTDPATPPSDLSLSDTTSNSSSASICPHCYNDINSSWQKTSQVHPISISNAHVNFDHFKSAANAALKDQFKGGNYDDVKALLLNWKENDIGLKTPETGSLVKDETLKLKTIFKEIYSYDAEYVEILSQNPETKVQTLLANAIDVLSDAKATNNKKVLFIVYYNGHGAMKDGKLIWSA